MPFFTIFLLTAYSLSLWISLAAMEILGWLLVVTATAQILVLKLRAEPFHWRSLLLSSKRPPGIDVWILVFLVGACIGALLQDRAPWWKVAGEARWVLILYALNFHLRSLSPSRWEKGVLLLALPMALAGFYGFFQFLTGIEFFRSKQVLFPYNESWRATGFFSVSLTYGCLMAMSVALAGSLLIKSPTWRIRAPYLLATAGTLLGLFAGLTRGTWIGLAAAVYLVVAIILKKRALVPLLIGTLVAGAGLGLDNVSRVRVQHLFDLHSPSYATRLSLWKANFGMLKDHPLFGVGYSQSSQYVLEYYEKLNINADLVGHAHNIYLEILSTTGLIGLLSYLGFSCGFLVMAWRLFISATSPPWPTRGIAIGSLTALLAFHIAGLSEANFTDAEITHFVIFLWANLSALYYRVEKDVSQT